MKGSTIAPAAVHESLGRHMLVDGYPFVLDIEKSHGTWLCDARTGKEYLDFFTYFASCPLGHNHPKLAEPGFRATLASIAATKVSNSDLYTTYMAEFVDTFARVAVPEGLGNLFFISGGALAVENALKAAFDWKVRKNRARGAKKETGQKVIHFREAFHGRTGYTMSLTNTDPTKTDLFPKFDWPRIDNPKIVFPLEAHLAETVEAEKKAIAQIMAAIAKDGDDIAAMIIEPIQGEGGDNHFRPEFFAELRRIADEHEIILIFDEVQTGVCMTGKMWCHQNFGVQPDILAFGKKTQVCGIMASERLNEVDSVFKVSSRINSTWGGNLVDMYRAKRIFEIIEEENLVDNCVAMGKHFQDRLHGIQEKHPDLVSNARGMGLFCAFDLPDSHCRDTFVTRAIERGMIVLKCGPRTVRFRPPINVTAAEIDRAAGILEEVCALQAEAMCEGDDSGAVHTE
ncbi:MAG: L-lysine 6-transaminase [Candidatus Krumholzibacteriota bacterium]|nr:L-lysine 6-transaminase [Candidatus Krumholzibacteriota bacterium]